MNVKTLSVIATVSACMEIMLTMMLLMVVLSFRPIGHKFRKVRLLKWGGEEKMKTIITFLLLLFIIWPFHACISSDEEIKSKELVVEVEGISVRVTVNPLPEFLPYNVPSSWRWGSENSCPKAFVGALEVKVMGMPVFVPLSAFADLGNPRDVRIESHNGNEFVVILTGGDAASSYTASLEFRDNLLSERMVRHGEFPDQSWERTLFKFNIGESYEPPIKK
jgi:hypothetical protein